jgi:small neutral amino acid transporter SnatA (MarC family)
VVVAVERLMGLILVAVSVEMMLRGFKAVAQQINAA